MFEHCNNIFDKISMIFAVIAFFSIGAAGYWFVGVFLHFGNWGIVGTIIFSACYMNYHNNVYKREIIARYEEEKNNKW